MRDAGPGMLSGLAQANHKWVRKRLEQPQDPGHPHRRAWPHGGIGAGVGGLGGGL